MSLSTIRCRDLDINVYGSSYDVTKIHVPITASGSGDVTGWWKHQRGGFKIFIKEETRS